MDEKWIIGIQVTDRVKKADALQQTLTTFGCTIKTRLGLHEVINDYCSSNGLILLELTGNKDEFSKLENELLKIEGIEVKKMVFSN